MKTQLMVSEAKENTSQDEKCAKIDITQDLVDLEEGGGNPGF